MKVSTDGGHWFIVLTNKEMGLVTAMIDSFRYGVEQTAAGGYSDVYGFTTRLLNIMERAKNVL